MEDDQATGSRPPHETGSWWSDDVWPQLVGDPATFARHWGRSPLVRSTAVDVGAVFGVADAERLLEAGLRRPAFRFVRDGATLPEGTGCRPRRIGGRRLEDVADPARVADAIADGATLVLQSLQEVDATVASFADALARDSGHAVQVNAYLSPPGARGLGSHSDAHDVIVLQVDGTKHWTVDGLGDVTLDPGWAMYVPAGVGHAARTLERSSLHLTVGIFPVTRRHLVERVLAGVPELDERLPPLFATDDPASAACEVRSALSSAAEALVNADADALVRAESPGVLTPRRPAMGWLRGPLGATIDDATTIAVRSGCRLAPRPAGTTEVTIQLGSRSLTMPDVAEPALTYLVDRRAACVADLPGLDRGGRAVLARRLVRERFAWLVVPAGVSDSSPGAVGGQAETGTTLQPEA